MCVRKAIVVWEATHGRRVPKGHAVIHVDGDWRNCEPDNLMCITRAALLRLNRMFPDSASWGDREARRAAILTAQLADTAWRRRYPRGVMPKGERFGACINYTEKGRHKARWLGTYDTIRQAEAAYAAAAKKLHREIQP